MSKLAKLLGLEDNMKYKFNSESGDFDFYFAISSSGALDISRHKDISTGWWNATGFEYELLINYTENVTPVYRWTKEEIENAKAIKQLYPDATHVRRELFFNGTKTCTRVRYPKGFVTIYNNCFPSLKDDEIVSLDEIIESEKYL